MITKYTGRFPLICFTPLYHFESASQEVVIADGIRIVAFDRFDGPSFDEIFGEYLQVYEPPYLLINDPVLSGDVSVNELGPVVDEQDYLRIAGLFLNATMKLFCLLRLFKPGRLRAGETFVVAEPISGGDSEEYLTVASARASTMSIDSQRLLRQATSYALDSGDIPFLSEFRKRLAPFIRRLESFPSLETAFNLYGADNPPYMEAIELVTALEALITKSDETEGLTFRLAMRSANILGQDANERKEIFKQVKRFYGLRSKLVHGAELDEKLMRRLNEVDPMRELLRRLLLSVMALLSDGTRPSDVPDLIDELAFDDELRGSVQARASAFLHI